jgi:16S rRNA (uracil1498-N3)-methyltransferase
MYLFYSSTISDKYHFLSQEESRHCIKVLRLKNGETVHLTDGLGNLIETVIVDDNFNKCKLEIKQIISEFGKRNFNLHIAVAPTKNINRFEWFLEKATEIGIDNITPVICEHSERRTLPRDRLYKVITSAMKQSLKAYHPKLNDIIGFQEFIQQDFYSQKFIAIYDENYKDSLKDLYRRSENALIIIGPEGDFSKMELKDAVHRGFIPLSLGPERLRTETAALVACITLNLMNQ